jgi:MoxR-like ATPase
MATQTYQPNENGASAAINSDALKYSPIRRTPTNLPPVPGAPTQPGLSAGQNASIQAITQNVQAASGWVRPLQQEIGRVIVGQNYLINRLLVGLLANGHLLLEGVPGLAKTLSLRTLAGAIQAKFQRIQFTPDMLPADIVGTLIYNPREGTFDTKHGPIFSNLVLADEINRAPAKVQSALLEAMAERQVTLGNETYLLPEPFLVLATQNPIEQEGTYNLPEAQVDRFMLKLVITYPNRAEELAIQDSMSTTSPALGVQPVVSIEDILKAREVVNSIYIDQKVREYIVDLVMATRDPKAYGLDLADHIQYGASPRGTINLTIAARAAAFLAGRGYVTPQDVKNLAIDVLRHRVSISYEAEAENLTSDLVVQRIIDTIPVP